MLLDPPPLPGPFSRDALASLPPEALPLITGFRLALVDGGKLGPHLVMESPDYGELACFVYWDHADRMLRQLGAADVPAVSADFDDLDQGWSMVILRRGDEVFVFTGVDDVDAVEAGFRVPFADWYAAWRAVVAQAGGALPALPP